jgi:hypothetical protein
MADGISLADKLATFGDFWSPRTITTFNDCDVMVVKVRENSPGTSTMIPTISFSS